MREFKIILLIILFTYSDQIAQSVPKDDDGAFIKGRGAIQGQFSGDVSGRIFSLQSIDTDSTFTIELREDEKFTSINLLPGYYRLQEEFNAVNTLLDSVPVRADSMTILKTIQLGDDFYHEWEPSPPSDRVFPQESYPYIGEPPAIPNEGILLGVASKSNWIIVPINNIRHQ